MITMIHEIYNGAAWHGPSISEVLSEINAEQAFKPTQKIHRICELVQHMISWRLFAIHRLKGDHNYEVSDRENWPPFENQDEEAWQQIKNKLKESQTEIIDALQHFKDESLDDLVERKAYSYYVLVHGVIQHDLYHLGQIILLSKIG